MYLWLIVLLGLFFMLFDFNAFVVFDLLICSWCLVVPWCV